MLTISYDREMEGLEITLTDADGNVRAQISTFEEEGTKMVLRDKEGKFLLKVPSKKP